MCVAEEKSGEEVLASLRMLLGGEMGEQDIDTTQPYTDEDAAQTNTDQDVATEAYTVEDVGMPSSYGGEEMDVAASTLPNGRPTSDTVITLDDTTDEEDVEDEEEDEDIDNDKDGDFVPDELSTESDDSPEKTVDDTTSQSLTIDSDSQSSVDARPSKLTHTTHSISDHAQHATSADPVNWDVSVKNAMTGTLNNSLVTHTDAKHHDAAVSKTHTIIVRDTDVDCGLIEMDSGITHSPGLEEDNECNTSPNNEDSASQSGPVDEESTSQTGPIDEDNASQTGPVDKDNANQSRPVDNDNVNHNGPEKDGVNQNSNEKEDIGSLSSPVKDVARQNGRATDNDTSVIGNVDESASNSSNCSLAKESGSEEPPLAKEIGCQEPSLAKESGSQEPSLAKDSGSAEPSLAKDSGSQEPSLAKDGGSPEPPLAKDSGSPESPSAKDSGSPESPLTKDSGSPEPSLAKDSSNQSAYLEKDNGSQSAHLEKDNGSQEADCGMGFVIQDVRTLSPMECDTKASDIIDLSDSESDDDLIVVSVKRARRPVARRGVPRGAPGAMGPRSAMYRGPRGAPGAMGPRSAIYRGPRGAPGAMGPRSAMYRAVPRSMVMSGAPRPFVTPQNITHMRPTNPSQVWVAKSSTVTPIGTVRHVQSQAGSRVWTVVSGNETPQLSQFHKKVL